MSIQNLTVPEVINLYYLYGKAENSILRSYLKNISIVIYHKADGQSKGKYYPLSPESLENISKNPRNMVLALDTIDVTQKPLSPEFKVWKEISFLSKTSTRLSMGPTIGELFDQIFYPDLMSRRIKAICVLKETSVLLPGTSGQHFLMKAQLLTS